MDNYRWLRVITIGLILAIIAVGYLLFTGAFSGSKIKKTVEVSPAPVAEMQTPAPSNSSAYNTIVQRNQKNIKTLPKTGFPIEVLGVFFIGVATVGWGLRKYPN